MKQYQVIISLKCELHEINKNRVMPAIIGHDDCYGIMELTLDEYKEFLAKITKEYELVKIRGSDVNK